MSPKTHDKRKKIENKNIFTKEIRKWIKERNMENKSCLKETPKG